MWLWKLISFLSQSLSFSVLKIALVKALASKFILYKQSNAELFIKITLSSSSKIIREEDTIARIGGDEFIVLLDNVGNNKIDAKTNMTNLAEKIKDTLNSITHIEGHINISTPSIGITLFSDASVSVKDIIKQADTAMYVAKKQGKNSIEFFD